MRYPVYILLGTLALTGCATGTDPAVPVDNPEPVKSLDGAHTAAEVKVVPERPLPDESVYPLLVAEFALRRREYDLALNNYLEQSAELNDAGVSAHTSRLAQFLKRDQEAMAATLLWVDLEPDNMEARLTLANMLARNGRISEALPHMVAVIDAGGMANFTALAGGFGQLDEDDQLRFLSEIKNLQQQYPDNTQLMICQALLLEEMDKPTQAIYALEPVFTIDPQQLQAVVLEAKLKQDLNRTDGMYDRIEALLEDDPGNKRLRMQYARLLTRTDIKAARTQFQLLLDQSPNDPDLLFSMALIQRETGDLDGARIKLEKLLDMGARTGEAHYYLGKTAEQQARYPAAINHYMRVPPGRDYPAATNRIASLLLAAGKTDDVEQFFAVQRSRYPRLTEQLYAIEADNLMRSDHLDLALIRLNQGLELIPGSTALQYTRSMVAEQTGDLAMMESDLRAILAREPENSTALNALGYTLANRGDRYLEAEQLISRALVLQPGEPAILDSMGWVKYRLGEYKAALHFLRQAYAAFPDPEVAAHLGEVLWVTGESDSALTIWNTALQESPDHVVLLETMSRLGAYPETP
jgi:tetratricopeptide (TPR) repeat protein